MLITRTRFCTLTFSFVLAWQAVQGRLRISPKNYAQCFVPCPSLSTNDVAIDGLEERNRALEGDIVVVELFAKSQWQILQKDAERSGVALPEQRDDPAAFPSLFVRPTGRVRNHFSPLYLSSVFSSTPSQRLPTGQVTPGQSGKPQPPALHGYCLGAELVSVCYFLFCNASASVRCLIPRTTPHALAGYIHCRPQAGHFVCGNWQISGPGWK